jgi:HSP20 family protein
MLTKHAKPKSFTSLTPNVVNPLENREMLKDWRLKIHFPPVNVSKRKEWHIVRMAIPGLKKEDIKINVKANVLTISAEKEEKVKETNENYTHQEYNYRSFKRSFSLPENVDAEGLESKYKKGILVVRLPKKTKE